MKIKIRIKEFGREYAHFVFQEKVCLNDEYGKYAEEYNGFCVYRGELKPLQTRKYGVSDISLRILNRLIK